MRDFRFDREVDAMLLSLTGMVITYRGLDWRVHSKAVLQPGKTLDSLDYPPLLDVTLEMCEKGCKEYRHIRRETGQDWVLDVLSSPEIEEKLIWEILNEN